MYDRGPGIIATPVTRLHFIHSKYRSPTIFNNNGLMRDCDIFRLGVKSDEMINLALSINDSAGKIPLPYYERRRLGKPHAYIYLLMADKV